MNVSVWRDELAQLRTNKKEFLEQMERLIPWGEWKAIIEPHYYKLDSGKFCTTRNEKRAHKFCANHEKTSGKVRKRKLYAAFEVFSDSAGF